MCDMVRPGGLCSQPGTSVAATVTVCGHAFSSVGGVFQRVAACAACVLRGGGGRVLRSWACVMLGSVSGRPQALPKPVAGGYWLQCHMVLCVGLCVCVCVCSLVRNLVWCLHVWPNPHRCGVALNSTSLFVWADSSWN